MGLQEDAQDIATRLTELAEAAREVEAEAETKDAELAQALDRLDELESWVDGEGGLAMTAWSAAEALHNEAHDRRTGVRTVHPGPRDRPAGAAGDRPAVHAGGREPVLRR